MTELGINWLKDVESFEIKGRGTIFTGSSPFSFAKDNEDDMDKLYNRPWVISYSGMKNKLWKVTALESYCINFIGVDTPIGIIVEPWSDKNE